ncbi:hypothetical protein B0H11DRAFT_1367727 [Mycena galericulata]|nr:hypothetical protein B0H11DRAFT_1367727 [Mycena galericulata]
MESECKRRCEDTDETGSGCLGCALVNSASAGLWVLPSVGSAMVWVERWETGHLRMTLAMRCPDPFHLLPLVHAAPPRHNSGGRPPPSPSVSKVITDALRSRTEARLRSLSSAAQSTSSTSNKASFSISAKMSSPAHPNEPPNPLKKAEVETSSASSTSDSGSDSLGSITESTVTSDEGFTDYLSDESEAELQRQAEAKAAQFAQNEAEELEFR